MMYVLGVADSRLRRLSQLALVLVAGLSLCTPALAAAWPGETWTSATDLTALNPSGWASNLSGAFWNPDTRRLWVCTNGPARFWALNEDGLGSFQLEREYAGTGDLEGITQFSTVGDKVFVIDESARILRAYLVDTGAASDTWTLSDIPDWGNSGPEGIAFVPDSWLAQSGFVDGNGDAYPQSVHGASGFGGVLFVAVQTNGWVYAFDLRTDGTQTFVGRYLTSRSESCELAFDPSNGRMFILHNTAGNWLEVTDLTSTLSGSDRKFNTLFEIQVPSGSNIEGFALTPAAYSSAPGDHWCFFTDDSNVDGALRWFEELPSTMAKNAGDSQIAGVGQAVVIPPSVAAYDAYGNPIAGLAVTFAVQSGGGSVTGGAAATTASGIATVGSWTLGATPGENTLTASCAGLTGSPQQFTATAVLGVPALGPLGSAALVLLCLIAGLVALARTGTATNSRHR
ncbi:MAG: SdiA-regulated domain-containing protein [Candidatus Hydrogenedentes bacterium]|nr:SdiA-regulated domain-containing protein [Candidatus Hydrogenedentota bacterium]